MSCLANSSLPPMILLEDANDLADFYEYSGRTVPRNKWADDSIAAAQVDEIEGLF